MRADMDMKQTVQFRQIGAKIVYYRTLRGLCRDELAQRANIKPDELGQVERGELYSKFSVDMLFAIAKALRVKESALMTFCGDERRMWREGDLFDYHKERDVEFSVEVKTRKRISKTT